MLVALRSRRQIAPFAMHRPTTLAEAIELRQAPGTSAFLAGGIDLIDWLKHGHAIDRVIRLDGVPGLADIAAGPNLLRIGAMATHAAIADSAAIRSVLPDLAAVWQGIANPRVRVAGTLGGNVMAGHRDYDGLPALLALGALAELAAAAGTTLVPIAELAGAVPAAFAGGTSSLVAGFGIADPAAQRLHCDRSLRPALTVWLGLTVAAERVTALRLAIGMAYPVPVCVARPLDMDIAKLGRESACLARALAELVPQPVSDGRATASYRRRMVEVVTRRLLIRAGGTA